MVRVHLKLGSLRRARGAEALTEDAEDRCLLIGVPDDHEIAIGLQVDIRHTLVAWGVGIDLELGALRSARRIEAAGKDAGTAGSVLSVAVPGDDEVSVGVHPGGGQPLSARGVGVHLELDALRHSGCVEAPGEDAGTADAVLSVAGPGDDEVAGVVAIDRRLVLNTLGVRVRLKVDALGSAGGVEAAGEHAVVGSVTSVTGPDDDELAGRGRRHLRVVLVIDCEGVDGELAPDPDRYLGA